MGKLDHAFDAASKALASWRTDEAARRAALKAAAKAMSAAADRIAATKEAIALISDLATTGNVRDRQRNTDPTLSNATQQVPRENYASMVRIAECYLQYDSNEIGRAHV